MNIPCYVSQHSIVLDSVDSTNNYVAKGLLDGNYTSGTVILAHFQTQGRGQRGSAWQSEADLNLTFSVGLDTSFLPLHRQFLLAKAVSLALHDTAAHLLKAEVHVKWPNDLLVHGHKIAGMLIERPVGPYSIVGIGFNVNQLHFDGGFKATSMAIELGSDLPVMEVLELLRCQLNLWLGRLHGGEYDDINSTYLSRLYGAGQWIDFEQGQRTFAGMIAGVDEQGMLLVRSRQGQAQQFASKEVVISY